MYWVAPIVSGSGLGPLPLEGSAGGGPVEIRLHEAPTVLREMRK